jgi:hypothetical protein
MATAGDPDGELDDPWCSAVWTERPPGPVWIAVCYRECLARPVRVQPAGCGCDDTSCEYSRWRDGYELRVLERCPPSHQETPPSPQDFLDSLAGPLPECPPVPEDPCVVLAAVTVDTDGTVTAIDNCTCRRMVASTATLWWRCTSGMVEIASVTVTPKSPPVGATGVRLVVRGTNLRADMTVDLGPDVTLTQQKLTGAGNLQLVVDIAHSATPGPRTLTLTTPDCSMATLPNALPIAPAR